MSKRTTVEPAVDAKPATDADLAAETKPEATFDICIKLVVSLPESSGRAGKAHVTLAYFEGATESRFCYALNEAAKLGKKLLPLRVYFLHHVWVGPNRDIEAVRVGYPMEQLDQMEKFWRLNTRRLGEQYPYNPHVSMDNADKRALVGVVERDLSHMIDATLIEVKNMTSGQTVSIKPDAVV